MISTSKNKTQPCGTRVSQDALQSAQLNNLFYYQRGQRSTTPCPDKTCRLFYWLLRIRDHVTVPQTTVKRCANTHPLTGVRGQRSADFHPLQTPADQTFFIHLESLSTLTKFPFSSPIFHLGILFQKVTGNSFNLAQQTDRWTSADLTRR